MIAHSAILIRTKGVVEPMGHATTRWIGVAVLTVAFVVTGDRAFPQQQGKPTAASSDKLNAIISDWAANSSQIKTLAVKVKRIDRRPLHTSTEFNYDIRWKSSGLASVAMEQAGRKRPSEFDERLVWTGNEVWEYRVAKKEIKVWKKEDVGDYEMFRLWIRSSGWGRFMGNQFDSIFPALGNPKGIDPLPFVVGMKEIVARKQFKFELFDETDPERVVVKATLTDPSQNTTFDHIFITLNRKRHLPIAVEYQKGWGGKDSRQYTLVAVQLDQPIDDGLFVPKKLAGWTMKSASGSEQSGPGRTQVPNTARRDRTGSPTGEGS